MEELVLTMGVWRTIMELLYPGKDAVTGVISSRSLAVKTEFETPSVKGKEGASKEQARGQTQAKHGGSGPHHHCTGGRPATNWTRDSLTHIWNIAFSMGKHQ